jgi:hypothetical protein
LHEQPAHSLGDLLKTRGLRQLVTTGPETTVAEAIELLQQTGISQLPVLQDGKPVGRTNRSSTWTRLSAVRDDERAATLGACRDLTNEVFEGLDLGGEIAAVAAQRLGDTVLLWGSAGLAGLAVCHLGPGTEAGSGSCYLKFGAVRPGPAAGEDFERLLEACEKLAAVSGVARLIAGVNMARHEAYRAMLAHAFRTDLQGVAMHRPNEPGYNRPGVYLIDDWR